MEAGNLENTLKAEKTEHSQSEKRLKLEISIQSRGNTCGNLIQIYQSIAMDIHIKSSVSIIVEGVTTRLRGNLIQIENFQKLP